MTDHYDFCPLRNPEESCPFLLTSTTQLYLNTKINETTVAVAEKTIECTHEGDFTVTVDMKWRNQSNKTSSNITSLAHMNLYEVGML